MKQLGAGFLNISESELYKAPSATRIELTSCHIKNRDSAPRNFSFSIITPKGTKVDVASGTLLAKESGEMFDIPTTMNPGDLLVAQSDISNMVSYILIGNNISA
jgi:hypothetical protein